MKELINKIDKIALFFIIYTLIFLLFFNTIDYTLPFVLALICALILRRPTLFITKKFKIKNGIASLITTTVFFAIILLVLSLGIIMIAQEAVQFGKNVQIYISNNYNELYNSLYNLQKYYNNLDPYIINTFEGNFTSFITKASNVAMNFSGKLVSYLVNLVATIPYLLMVILFTLLTTYFFTKDMTSSKTNISNLIPDNKTANLAKIYNESKKMIGNYLLSYMIIISLTFIETLIVFSIFKIKYALILSIICAIADILPIIGIGVIYIPLALIYLIIAHNYVICIGLIISYLLVSIIRQIIEPKIVSSSLGIHPVAVLASLFIGLKINGLSGVIFCIFLVIFFNIFRKLDML
ncbi:sporulation integral membrane protein YtvI [Clostridium luticellarii]|uniref:Pheromone autoinducer 2 transporter n=1 Tax=Clostridium luticellarii TaxID=1691940 RepID=A0A2T0B3W5_9CLOT|nr:sporulation integral membrane protein YtvI [Clostridium luticellarii]MCI1945860.1 sporulation integral membrane protein YtvI [Clostridium luticellarii]MCI1969192.1 sporulation integral membrane protein YtvI [Clostridium luticellarii]MCI1996164.1 sporulation integral membrane protein YtvI [Clostridium luticellarii]MCI2040503.1 sporulation integral membrane protein YtvI [Clostridium luticellarii]PRR78576.1 pheromone autoinducer 2 transporter [Clostridium luticellarii]